MTLYTAFRNCYADIKLKPHKRKDNEIMLNSFKKISLVLTTAFLFCLTIISGTTTLRLPSIVANQENVTAPTPFPEESEITTLADDDDERSLRKGN